MPKDEIDAAKVLRELAELKRTMPEDQYQELERQVLPRLAEHYGGKRSAKSGDDKKSGWASTVGSILWIIIFWCLITPGLLGLAERSYSSGNTGTGVVLTIVWILLLIGMLRSK